MRLFRSYKLVCYIEYNLKREQPTASGPGIVDHDLINLPTLILLDDYMLDTHAIRNTRQTRFSIFLPIVDHGQGVCGDKGGAIGQEVHDREEITMRISESSIAAPKVEGTHVFIASERN